MALVVVRLPMFPDKHRARRAERGFTLVELIVVVIIIAVLAVMAIPTITQQMRSRRTQFAAKEVAALYRDARMRAMGRGSAVLVRFESNVTAEGRLEMREAVRSGSANPNCNRLPVSSCTIPSWQAANPDNMLVRQFTSFQRGELADIRARATGAPPTDANVKTQMDICFTPMGRTFVRYDPATPFVPLTGVPKVEVFRYDSTSGSAYGIARQILILPNGNARLGTAEVAN